MKNSRKAGQKETTDGSRDFSGHFRSLFESSPDGMMLTRQDGTILAANRRMCEMLTMTEEEILRAGRAGIMVDDGDLRAAIRERARTGQFQGELTARRADGSVFPVEISSSLFTTTEGGEMTAIVVRDIGERKGMEDALRRSENRYRSLFETSQDSIFIVDQETGDFVAANDAACHLYGYTENEFLRMKNTAVSAEPIKTKTATRDAVTTVPLRSHRKKDGTVFPVEIAGGYFDEGNRKMHTAFIRDITERKRMEERLIESEALSKMLFNLPQDNVVLLTDKDGVLLDFNRSLSERLGLERDQLLGKCVFDFLPPDIAKSRRRASGKVLRTGKPVRVMDVNGKYWYEHVAYPIFDEGGAVEKIAVFSYDITALKKAEGALQASEQKYRNVFAAESDALFLVDQETGAIKEVNDAACDLYGYTREELLRLKGIDLSAEPDETLRSIRGPDRRVHNRLHRKKDGTTFPVDISVSRFVLDGHPVALGASRDMTAARDAEDELRRHRDRLEDLVKERTAQLERKTASVEELNAALKVLLSQMQESKEALEQHVVSNVRKLVLPYLDKISKGRLDEEQRSSLGVMEANLNQIISPFLHNVQQLNLTPRETQVAALIKDGKTTKEIAEIAGVAKKAIDAYRNSIRKKLGLNKKKVNLQSYLQSLR